MSFRDVFTRGLFALLAFAIGGQALAARTTTFFHTDGLGSVVAATNEAGQVLWRKDYAPFGAQLNSPPNAERTSYTGKQHDHEIGLTYFGGRYFDPQIGRFVSVDPVGFVEDNTMSFNRYLYVNNNPYKYVDPDGRFLNFVAKFVADVAITVAINYVTSGSLGIGAALQESAMGVLNPAKTIVKAKRLVGLLKKADKVSPDPGTVAKATNYSQRPSRVRKSTEKGNWDGAENGPTGGKLCPTCGKEVKRPPNTKNKDWQNDHNPKWNERDLTGMERKDVLNEFNKETRLRCTSCNVADNQ